MGFAWRPGITMLPDGEGGVFIAWEDIDSQSVFAQRLNAAGEALWGGNGVNIALVEGFKFSPRAVSDGAGGFIIAWVDGRAGFCSVGFQGECDIFAQRLDGVGQRLWQSEGIPITTAERNQGVSGIAITSDGAGGAILAWEDARPPDCCRIFAQRVNASGLTVWADDGVPVSPPPTWVIGSIGAPPQAVSDGMGGAIVAWLNIQVNPSTDLPTIALQRLDPNGQELWASGGISVGFPSRTVFGGLTTDSAGGAIVAWPAIGRDGFDDIFAQRIGPTGLKLWEENGVSVAGAAFAQLNLDMVADGSGGAIIVWEDERDGTSGDCFGLVGDCKVYGQRLNTTGQPLWAANGLRISGAANSQRSPRVVSDGSGGSNCGMGRLSEFARPELLRL